MSGWDVVTPIIEISPLKFGQTVCIACLGEAIRCLIIGRRDDDKNYSSTALALCASCVTQLMCVLDERLNIIAQARDEGYKLGIIECGEVAVADAGIVIAKARAEGRASGIEEAANVLATFAEGESAPDFSIIMNLESSVRRLLK